MRLISPDLKTFVSKPWKWGGRDPKMGRSAVEEEERSCSGTSRRTTVDHYPTATEINSELAFGKLFLIVFIIEETAN